jgi:hypothetical protein
VWISLDTVLYDGVREIADHTEIDTALLHLGGVEPCFGAAVELAA